jgi:hypothetical protein
MESLGRRVAGVLISLVGLVGIILVVPGVLICYAALSAATAHSGKHSTSVESLVGPLMSKRS